MTAYGDIDFNYENVQAHESISTRRLNPPPKAVMRFPVYSKDTNLRLNYRHKFKKTSIEFNRCVVFSQLPTQRIKAAPFSSYFDIQL